MKKNKLNVMPSFLQTRYKWVAKTLTRPDRSHNGETKESLYRTYRDDLKKTRRCLWSLMKIKSQKYCQSRVIEWTAQLNQEVKDLKSLGESRHDIHSYLLSSDLVKSLTFVNQMLWHFNLDPAVKPEPAVISAMNVVKEKHIAKGLYQDFYNAQYKDIHSWFEVEPSRISYIDPTIKTIKEDVEEKPQTDLTPKELTKREKKKQNSSGEKPEKKTAKQKQKERAKKKELKIKEQERLERIDKQNKESIDKFDLN